VSTEVIFGIPASFLAIRCAMRSVYYRSYFFAKQRIRGEDPKRVLRREFPWIWWML
jgi:hypothetical protein